MNFSNSWGWGSNSKDFKQKRKCSETHVVGWSRMKLALGLPGWQSPNDVFKALFSLSFLVSLTRSCSQDPKQNYKSSVSPLGQESPGQPQSLTSWWSSQRRVSPNHTWEKLRRALGLAHLVPMIAVKTYGRLLIGQPLQLVVSPMEGLGMGFSHKTREWVIIL